MNRIAEAFLDTAYAIALSAPSDRYHTEAVKLANRMQRDRTRLVTTQAVLLEIGNALSRQRYRAAAITLLDALEEDANVEIVSLSDELFIRALQLYRNRPDKEWGLTDCVSCVVMEERGITGALTTDEHFRQMGFQALLLTD